jgi:hypothetical protein
VHLPSSQEVETAGSPMCESESTKEHVSDLEEGCLGQVAEVFEDAGRAHQPRQLKHTSHEKCCCSALGRRRCIRISTLLHHYDTNS